MNVIIKAKKQGVIFQGKLLDLNGIECNVSKLKDVFPKSKVSSDSIYQFAKNEPDIEVIELQDEIKAEVKTEPKIEIEKTEPKKTEQKKRGK